MTDVKVNHQALSPDDASVTPAFQDVGAPVNTCAPVAAATSAYVAPGVNAPSASKPICGSRITATFSPSGRYPN